MMILKFAWRHPLRNSIVTIKVHKPRGQSLPRCQPISDHDTGGHIETALVQWVYADLRLGRRREVITTQLTQQQRLALEAWILRQSQYSRPLALAHRPCS
eukprot:5449731-Amphidinium_carterae.2